MLSAGTLLRTIVGDAFDIVSFDPRGMILAVILSLCSHHLHEASHDPSRSPHFSPITLLDRSGLPGRPHSMSSILRRAA